MINVYITIGKHSVVDHFKNVIKGSYCFSDSNCKLKKNINFSSSLFLFRRNFQL